MAIRHLLFMPWLFRVAPRYIHMRHSFIQSSSLSSSTAARTASVHTLCVPWGSARSPATKICIDTPDWQKMSKAIHEFVEAKSAGEIDTPEIRFLKTKIRQCEARIPGHPVMVCCRALNIFMFTLYAEPYSARSSPRPQSL